MEIKHEENFLSKIQKIRTILLFKHLEEAEKLIPVMLDIKIYDDAILKKDIETLKKHIQDIVTRRPHTNSLQITMTPTQDHIFQSMIKLKYMHGEIDEDLRKNKFFMEKFWDLVRRTISIFVDGFSLQTGFPKRESEPQKVGNLYEPDTGVAFLILPNQDYAIKIWW